MSNIPATESGCNPIPQRKLRADAKSSHDALCSLIATVIETSPCHMGGQDWAGPLQQEAWAAKAGLSLRTFKRLILIPPIVAVARGVGKNKASYLRLGVAEPNDLRKVQNTMAKIWREQIGTEQAERRDYRRDYGFVCGLAEELPRGWQVRIFEHALKRWGDFMACAKLEIEIAQQCAGYDVFSPSAMQEPLLITARKLHGQELFIPFLEFPALSFLRVFHHIATDLYVTDLQMQGRAVPEELQ